jgi:hypothetical protein
MGNTKTASAIPQAQENPIVLIRYQPENAPLQLANETSKMLARIQTVRAVTNIKQREQADEIIADARIASDQVETFLESLRAGIERACSRVREIPGYEDFEGSFTCRKWGIRQRLAAGIASLRNMRANFLAAEEEKLRRENLAKQAEQDRINAEDARKAAADAEKQGADKQTIADIKQAVMETPAPVVTSKALESATSTVRYDYSAQITDLKKFLGLCLNNEVFLNTLKGAIPEIEKQFRKMASDQKEAFSYAGITFAKKPVDVKGR